jgi:hypothetical protein
MNVRLRFVKLALGVILAVGLAIQVIRPARTNPPTDASRTLKARVSVPADVAQILDRACRDCHSNDTTWPWYSNVAPVSWVLIQHVKDGRRHLNFSDWARYTPRDARKLMTEVCKTVQEGEMPMGSYLWWHAEARLTSGDVQALCSWTRQVTGSAPGRGGD